MTREAEYQEGGNISDTRHTDERDGGNRSLLDRRSYLKLTGVAAVAAVPGATSAATGYDVVEVNAGDTFQKTLSQGETWENVLIDISAQGAGYRITATTDNWTIRNIGIRGQLDSTPGSQNFVVQVPSSGATGVIENVYLPGTAYSRSTSPFPSGIYVHFNHAGDLEIRNLYAENLPSHGVYGSDPGSPTNNGNGGTVRVHDSYVADTENSGFRIGSDGSYVDNCVSFRTVRGLWSRWANTEARGCDFGDNGTDIVVGQSGYSRSSTVTLDGSTRFETVAEANGTLKGSSAGTPQERIPASCPQTAEEAASGSTSSSSSNTPSADLPENTLTITGQGEPTKYYVETTDTIARNPDRGNLQQHDVIDGTSATGWVTTPDNVDGFRFDGELVDVRFEQGAARVEVNGTEIDPATYGGESTLDNVLLVDGVGTFGETNYEFTVGGAVERSNANGASINDADRINSGTVTGSVGGWRDAFRFSGELQKLSVEGNAQVYVNGEAVNPADYGVELPHMLTIVGNGTPSKYEVSVDGTIDWSQDDGSVDTATISGSSANGSIERGYQRFRFSGSVTDITFTEGSAHVYIDSKRVDPDEYNGQNRPPHAIVIDGTGVDGTSTYSFKTDGNVVASNYRDASIDAGDVIEGTSVSGSVENSLDAYWFDGNITDFQLTGDANVDVEYNARDT